MKTLLVFATLLIPFCAAAQTKKLQITAGLTATINHTQGSKVVQVLIPGVETIELELTQDPNNVFLIKTADYNFDGSKDFAFTSKDPNDPAAPAIYDIFVYNAEEKTFEAPENPGGVCGQLSNVRLNPAEKTLRSSCRSGNKLSVDVFRWASPNSLELTSSKDNTAEAQQEVAEEKAEMKAEKADARKEARDERTEKRKEKKEARDEDDDQ